MLSNITNNLKDIQTKSSREFLAAMQAPQNISIQASNQRIEGYVSQQAYLIQEMNKNMYSHMKNPYFEFFFKLIDKNHKNSLFDKINIYNVFDLVAILFRFASIRDIVKILQQQIKSGVE